MEELIKYICKDRKDRIVCFIGGVVFGAASAVLFVKESTFLAVAMLSIGLVLLAEALTAGIRDRKKIKKMDADGTIEKAALDFSTAQSYADGEIMFGDEFIFRSKMCVLIRYDDVVRAEYYQSSDVENNHHNDCIRVKLKNGKYEPLCTVYGLNRPEKINEIFSELRYYNPSIEISNPFA